MLKKLTSFVLLLAVLTAVCCGCFSPDTQRESSEMETTAETTAEQTTEETTASDTTEITEPIETTTEACRHRYEKIVKVPADEENEGLAEYVCSLCGNSYTEVIPKVKSIKVLAVGNSFSEDTTAYLWYICNAAGYNDIVIANLYIGSCSLDMHWDNIRTGANAYTYYRCTTGRWETIKNKSVAYALADADWDFITIHQKGNDSGNPGSYGNLSNILNYLDRNKPNKDTKIYWNMTWAYREGPDLYPGRYGTNQMNMYQSIVSTVRNVVVKNSKIDGVIPCGTVIQNLRTSYVKDNLLTAGDGFHLSTSYGRYATGLAWFAYLTGEPIDDITWVPGGHKSLSKHLDVIHEAVNNALKTPYAVTQSVYKTSPVAALSPLERAVLPDWRRRVV